MALHLLWITGEGLRSFHLAGGNLVADGEFAADDAGRAAFEAYLEMHRRVRWRLLVDLPEESLMPESLPPLRGRERRELA